MKKILFLILIFQIKLSFSQQQLSMKEAIKIGIENNYRIKISRHNLRAAQVNNSFGNSGLFPSLNLGVNQGNRYDERPLGITNEHSKYYTNSMTPFVNLNWNLIGGMRVHLTRQNYKLLEEVGEETLKNIVENTTENIILAYYNILLQEEKLKILEKAKNISRDIYEYIKIKKDFGTALSYDLLKAKNDYWADSSSFISQKSFLENAYNNLRLLLAFDNNYIFELTDKLEVEPKEFILENLEKKVLDNNSVLKNRFLSQKILENNLKMSKNNIYPNLSLNAGYDKNYIRTKYVGKDEQTSNNQSLYANLSLSFSLFNGQRKQIAIQQALINKEISGLEINEYQNSLKAGISNYLNTYNARKQIYMVAQENINAAELNLSISKERYNAGSINSFDFRAVQLQYIKIAFSKYEAIFNLIDSETKLLKMTGEILDSLNINF